MRSVLDEGDRQALCRRVASLTAGSSAQWGRFTVATMLAHLCQSTRMALGELPVKPRGKVAFQRFPLKHLILYVLPFPKGAPTAPELLAAPPDRSRTTSRLFRLCSSGWARDLARERVPPTRSSAPLSREEWGAATHKHTDHHLRQFGA